MTTSLTRQIRGLQGALMKVIKTTADKPIRLGKVFRSQVHIRKQENNLSISSTCNMHRGHKEQSETPLF